MTVDIISQYARIQVDRTASIVVVLGIVHPNGFIPNVGDAFPILTYALGHSGTFGSLTGTAAGPRTFTPAYTATNLTLNVT